MKQLLEIRDNSKVRALLEILDYYSYLSNLDIINKNFLFFFM